MNEEVRFVRSKTQAAVTREWDLIAPARDEQLRADEDLSFRNVLQPWILAHVGDARTVADAGCGTGRLTARIRQEGHEVFGLDPSPSSIRLARSHDAEGAYFVSTLERWMRENPESLVDVVIANMVLMDALDLNEFCRAFARLARGGGRGLITITHPAFWPFYWGYATNPGFAYGDEITVEAPFKTSSRKYQLMTTHIHRPISTYMKAFEAHGLRVTRFEELRGPEPVDRFPFPRFLGIEVRSLE